MAGFNYSKFHFFDKNGIELMLNKTNTININILNKEYPSCNSTYSLVLSDDGGDLTNSVLIKNKSGSRYPFTGNVPDDASVMVTMPNGEAHTVNIPSTSGCWQLVTYQSSNGTEGYPEFLFNDLTIAGKTAFLDLLGINAGDVSYPSMTFEGNLIFDKISTELVETQSIYVLVESTDSNGIRRFVDVATCANEQRTTNPDVGTYINNFNLFFFIDCRDQTDFRFFSIDGDDVVWSDRHEMDFQRGLIADANNGYRVDIGFRGEMEGVYDQKMYVCLIDKNNNSNVTVIGSFNMTAETEGEDERYRALIANFGLPKMDEIEPAFKENDINDDLPDYIMRNKHAKKLFLAYSEIFPYAGTYKALVNAVKFLGYDDIFFKEWYKDIGTPSPEDDGYVAYDVAYGSTSKLNTINNKPIEERIHLRKTNWISMMYHINEELELWDSTRQTFYRMEDKWGFPVTRSNTSYYDTDSLIKLISLKKWLEKYIIGVNCRITDVGGEGIVFERYSMLNFGQYQEVFDYTNEKSFSVDIKKGVCAITDGSANIPVEINTSDPYATFEEFGSLRFIDMCSGYFDDSSYYHDDTNNPLCTGDRATVYFGRTFEFNNNMDTFELRTRGDVDSIILDNLAGSFIDSTHPSLIVDNDRIIFNPHDLQNMRKTSLFKYLPVIRLTEARIKKYKTNRETFGELAYDASVYVDSRGKIMVGEITNPNSAGRLYEFNEEITLIPPTYEDDSNANIIKIYPKETTVPGLYNIRKKDGPYSIIGHSGATLLPFDNMTYGLRFTSDTLTGEPIFMIAGYICPQIHNKYNSAIFPEINSNQSDVYEYQIEIFNGSLLFNDTKHERQVSINFEFDGKKKTISVNTFQQSAHSTLYEYNIAPMNVTPSYVNRFTPGQQYNDFINGYVSDIDNYVIFQKIKTINVLNAGTYSIDAVIYDEFNNMFCVAADKQVNVVTPNIDASICVSGNSSIGDARHIIDIQDSEKHQCVYEYVPKLNILSRNGIDTSVFATDNIQDAFTDNGTYLFRNDSSFLYAQFTNTTERFIYNGCYDYSDSSVLSFIRKSFRWTQNGPILVDSSIDINSALGYDGRPITGNRNIDTDLLNCLHASYGISLADVVVLLYDDTIEYPLFAYPGVCLPTIEYAAGYVFDEYRVILDCEMTADEREGFMNYIKNPSCTIYIIPAWSVKCKINDSNTLTVLKRDGTVSPFPFEKKIVLDDTYKMLFQLTNDFYGQSSCHTTNRTTDTVSIDASLNTLYTTQDSSIEFSHAARDFFQFILKTSPRKFNYTKGDISLENTPINREAQYYIDSTYAASFRNFDITNGILLWNDSSISTSNDMTWDIHPIETDDGMVYVVPLMGNEYVSNTDDPAKLLKDKNITVHWKIYKQNGIASRELLLECFNKILPLSIETKGTYDIEFLVYDEQGNRYEKSMIGIITKK